MLWLLVLILLILALAGGFAVTHCNSDRRNHRRAHGGARSMRYAKAGIALLVAIAAALVTALGTSPQQNLSHFGTRDWVMVIGAVLASGAITAVVENIAGIAGGIIKAVVASAGSFITALIAAYADNMVTQAELIGAISAGLVALAAVYQTPNLVTVTRATARRVAGQG